MSIEQYIEQIEEAILKPFREKLIADIEAIIDAKIATKLAQSTNTQTTNTSTPVSTPPPVVVPPSTSNSLPSDGSLNFFAGKTEKDLYQDPSGTLVQFVLNNPNDPDINIIKKVAQHPTFTWPVGGTPSDVYNKVLPLAQGAKANNELLLLTPYNFPNRDNGGQSAQQQSVNVDQYKAWCGSIDAAIKDAGNPNTVIVHETDILGLNSHPINYSVFELYKISHDELTQNPGRSFYIPVDMWDGQSIDRILKELNVLRNDDKITNVRGVALNIAGFDKPEDCITVGEKIYDATGYHYIIDTSRNGNGPYDNSDGLKDEQGNPMPWCNPPGRALGPAPLSPVPANAPHCDAFVWIKIPGESDGPRRGGVPAGLLFKERLVEMAKNAGY